MNALRPGRIPLSLNPDFSSASNQKHDWSLRVPATVIISTTIFPENHLLCAGRDAPND
jgi:hypothetical protein